MGHRDFRLRLTAWGENCPQPAGRWTATSRRAHVRGELVSQWVQDPRYPCRSPPSSSLFPEARQAGLQGPAQANAPWADPSACVAGCLTGGVFYTPAPRLQGVQGAAAPPQVWPPAVLGDRPFAFDFVGRFQNIPPSEISRECTTLHIVIQSRMSTRLILSFLNVTQQRTQQPGCESHEATLLAHYRCNNRQDDQRCDRSGAL